MGLYDVGRVGMTRRSEGVTDPLGYDGSGVRGGGNGMPNPILEVSNSMLLGGGVTFIRGGGPPRILARPPPAPGALGERRLHNEPDEALSWSRTVPRHAARRPREPVPTFGVPCRE